MAIYRNSTELAGKKLALGDYVVFSLEPGKTLTGFHVTEPVSRIHRIVSEHGVHLNALGLPNSTIWSDLGLHEPRHDIAAHITGKRVVFGSAWPTSEEITTEDATKIVMALFNHIEEKEDITACLKKDADKSGWNLANDILEMKSIFDRIVKAAESIAK
jgi:hypothetical protein